MMFSDQNLEKVVQYLDRNYQKELLRDYNRAYKLARDDYVSIIIAIFEILFE